MRTLVLVMSEILCRLLGKKATGCRKLIAGRWEDRRNSLENRIRVSPFYVEGDRNRQQKRPVNSEGTLKAQT